MVPFLENLDEFQGPFVVRKPITINGRALLRAKQGPVMTIASAGVTLQNLHMEVSGEFSSLTDACRRCDATRVRSNSHSVSIRGMVEGLIAQAGEWSYPSQIDAGAYRPNATTPLSSPSRLPYSPFLNRKFKGFCFDSNQLSHQSTEILVKTIR